MPEANLEDYCNPSCIYFHSPENDGTEEILCCPHLHDRFPTIKGQPCINNREQGRVYMKRPTFSIQEEIFYG